MVRWLCRLLALAVLATPVAAPAFAQEDLVVVTGSMIQSDDEYQEDNGVLPYVSVTVPADFVMFTVELETGTTSVDERRRELEKTFAAMADRVKRAQGIVMEVGRPGRSSAIETTAAKEAIVYTKERSSIPLVMKFAIRAGENFSAVRARAEKFIEDVPVTGRVEAVTGDEQYIGLSDAKKHREALLRKIADDTHLMQSIFNGQPASAAQGLRGVSLVGLGNRVKTRPVGPLEIEMFIPYSIVLGEPLPQPPPR